MTKASGTRPETGGGGPSRSLNGAHPRWSRSSRATAGPAMASGCESSQRSSGARRGRPRRPGRYGAGWLLARICMADLADVEGAFVGIGRALAAGCPRPRGSSSCRVPRASIRGMGDQDRRLLRDGVGPPSRGGTRRERALREARIRRGARRRRCRRPWRARSRVASAARRDGGRVGRRARGRAGVAPCLRRRPHRKPCGTVQISARMVETGLHKIEKLGFDVRGSWPGSARRPSRPSRSTTCAPSAARTTASSTEDARVHGLGRRRRARGARRARPLLGLGGLRHAFYEIFKRYDGDFYKIDPLLFSRRRCRSRTLPAVARFAPGRERGVLQTSLFE